MKSILKTVFQGLGQMALILLVLAVFNNFDALTSWAGSLPISSEAETQFEEGDIPVPPDASGQEITKQLVFGALVYLKAIVAVVGVLFITILGLQLVLSRGSEEDIEKAKKGLIYAVLSFAIISMSQDLARIFDQEQGTLLESPQSILERVHLFDKEVEIAITFIKFFIGAYATLMVIRAAIGMVTAGGDEEETNKNKSAILYSGGGLILIYVGEIFIDKVFYKVDKNVYSGITGVHPQMDAKEGVEQIIGITNFVVSLLAPLAVLMLIIGAVMYATAGGDEENIGRAKRFVVATVIGITIIYGAFALVSTVISSRLTEIGTIAQ